MPIPRRAPEASETNAAAPFPPTYRIPPFTAGQRIGLFGGTFDPPHEAHLGACLLAMKRLRLDRVWWLVTPGNPLKDTRGLAPLDQRIAAARALANHPRIVVTGLEAGIGVRFTYDTIRHLVTHCPGVHFVWIMGADNLRQFHLWRHWRAIADLVPILVIDRPGSTLNAISSRAGATLARWRVAERDASRFASMKPPALLFLHGPRSSLSSTALRRVGEHGEATPVEISC
jgi:nicotinate-nucleotide adenylyltransferase